MNIYVFDRCQLKRIVDLHKNTLMPLFWNCTSVSNILLALPSTTSINSLKELIIIPQIRQPSWRNWAVPPLKYIALTENKSPNMSAITINGDNDNNQMNYKKNQSSKLPSMLWFRQIIRRVTSLSCDRNSGTFWSR